MIRAKAEEGKDATKPEVIREALRAWQEREERRQARLEHIRQSIREAEEDPRRSLSEEEVDAALDAMFTEGARGAA